MAFTLEELLPDDQRPRTVQLHDTVQDALNLMYQHGFDQLPVVDKDGKTSLGLVVTFESVLQATRFLSAKLDNLFVSDVARGARTHLADADLLATLDDIQRESFALIVDDVNALTGVVTTADTTSFFRTYAQDMMVIEGIESKIKDSIQTNYGNNASRIDAKIVEVTDYYKDIRKKVAPAIQGYLQKAGLRAPADDKDALAEAEKRLSLPKAGKAFDRLTFDEYIGVLLAHENPPKLAQSKDSFELRQLLEQVRDARNKLAHFRGELTIKERRTVQFASDWLERNLPTSAAESPASIPTDLLEVTDPVSPGEEDAPHGSYARLAEHLKSQAQGTRSLPITFQEIEKVLGKELPRSAYDYRVWWANDSANPQAKTWLEEDWRANALSMIERRLTFVRTDVRQKAYIEFFAALKSRLKNQANFPLRDASPQGTNWHTLASIPWQKPESANINAVFTRHKELRVELYLDSGDRSQNKARFDELIARKDFIESALGEPLTWDRLDERQACRIEVHTKAQIPKDTDNQAVLDWASMKAVNLYRVLSSEFTQPANQ